MRDQSYETYEGSKVKTHSVIHIIQSLLMEGLTFVLTERLNQVCLAEYFGMHRALGRRNNDPGLKQFGYQSDTSQILD